MRRSNWVSLVHDKLEVCLRLSSSDRLLIDKHISDRRMDGAKVLQQCSLPKGSLFNGKYTEAELYPGTTITFSREIEKTDAKNARGLRGEKAHAPFLTQITRILFSLTLTLFSRRPHWLESLSRARTTKTVRYSLLSAKRGSILRYTRGTQRQFSQYICSEDELRSRIFGTFVVRLPPLGFQNI